MAVRLRHAQALQFAADCGTLARNLYGRPGLVIGIARGGTAIAGVFAANSGADSFAVIKQQRPTSRGLRGKFRRLLVRAIPPVLRRLYKQLFFKIVVRITHGLRQPDPAMPDAATLTELETALKNRGPGIVWVIDDAIDSGGTAAVILRAVSKEAPDIRILLFTLTTSAGIRITEQLNVFAERLDYADGDISELKEAEVPVQEKLCSPEHQLSDSMDSFTEPRILYLDIDSVLNCGLLRSSVKALRIALWHSRSPLRASILAVGDLFFKAGWVSPQIMANRIDRTLASMPETDCSIFRKCLIEQLADDCRWSLVSIASADRVTSRLVTTAPGLARDALREALGIETLIAPAEKEAGQWHDADDAAKSRMITADIEQRLADNQAGRTLILGNGLKSLRAPTVQIVKDDRTGLLTILAADAWWSG